MEEQGEEISCCPPYSSFPPPSTPPAPNPGSPPPDAADIYSETLDDQGGPHEAAATPSSAVVLSDDLRENIVRQVEYYFSDENLPTDKFLLKFVKKDKEGFVPIAVIASFRKMKKLVQDNSLVEAALRTSSQLVVSLDEKKVKRLHPLPVIDVEDVKSRTVLVENLPENYSTDSIQRTFREVGNIKNISIRDLHTIEGSATINKEERLISSKVHALVEYETIEAAENAVATLNDEKDWRSGMRVELLLKRMGKYGLVRGVRKGAFSEKNNNSQESDKIGDEQSSKSFDQYDDMAGQEEREHFSGENNARRDGNRRRGRGPRQHTLNGHGHGSVPSGSSSAVLCKPAPGPRMPDGTRGFTKGRGKPTVSDHT